MSSYNFCMVKFELHQLFRIARESQKINQKALTGPVEKKQPSLSNFEKGKTPLSQETLRRIAPMLSINPAYVSDPTRNPLSSPGLIKMFFSESMLGKIDFDFIRFLYEANRSLDFLFLYPPISNVVKIIAFLGAFPVYAIALRDGDGNVILFRRENGNILVGGSVPFTENLELELSESARRDNKGVSFSRILINDDAYRRIQDWDSITRDEIERLFLPQNQIPVLGDNEYSLIMRLVRALRAGIVSHGDVEQLLEKKTKKAEAKKPSHIGKR